LFGNSPEDIIAAARATAQSVMLAREADVVSDWELRLGDSSAVGVLERRHTTTIRGIVTAAGGSFSHEVFGRNLGSAGGHNALAVDGQSELILILNPDARMAPDTVSALVNSLGTGVGITEARQVPLEHPKDFAATTGDTGWASTACAVTPRVLFDELAGFDSGTFFLYCDDVDYSWRVRLAGYRVVHVPEAGVFHDKRLTISGDWPPSETELYYSAEAAILLAHKYSRPRLVSRLKRRYARSSVPRLQKALEEYESRRSAGRLPAPIDPRHTVSEFGEVHYANHRF
jgi:hypothetical protein